MSKKLMTLLLPVLALTFAPAMMTGCEEETDVKDVKKDVKEGAEDAKDAVKEGAEDVKDAVKDATN